MYIYIFILLNRVAHWYLLRTFTPQLKVCTEQSDVWYIGEKTKCLHNSYHQAQKSKTCLTATRNPTGVDNSNKRVTLMVWNGLLCAESAQYPSPQIRFRLHPLVQHSCVFQAHLPDGKEFQTSVVSKWLNAAEWIEEPLPTVLKKATGIKI